MKPETVSDRDHPFDAFGIDRVRLREVLDNCRDMTDEEVVESLMERPVPRLAPSTDPNEARPLLERAVKDERALMAMGDAAGPGADPRYLSRTTSGRASAGEFFRQLDELADQAEAVADRTRGIRDRLRARMDGETDDDPARELPSLVGDLGRAWANAHRIRWAMRRTAGGLPPWDRDDRDGEEWRGEE